MADPTEFARLREATQFRLQCLDFMAEGEGRQNRRWEVLRRVVENAGKQFTSMRIDMVEERMTEEGAPLWFSVVLTLAITFIPVQSLTTQFLEHLTEGLGKLLTRSGRASLALVTSAATRELDIGRQALTAVRLANRIKAVEERAAKFASTYEPEIHHTLVGLAHKVGEMAGKHLFEQEPADKTMSRRTDAPIVIVTESLQQWIDSMVRVEASARKRTRDSIRDLFDIATATDPAKEAKTKEIEAAQREAARQPRIALRRPADQLPKTYKDALDQLSSWRDELAPSASEDDKLPVADDLRDLQLMIEGMMWATTYDFTPIRTRGTVLQPRPSQPVVAPDLPDALWKRLIERFVDPDAGRSYSQVGTIQRLGTVASPSPAKSYFDPDTRLAHYFSQILYPQIMNENSEIVQRIQNLGGAPPAEPPLVVPPSLILQPQSSRASD
jgi:hypothetical protein